MNFYHIFASPFQSRQHARAVHTAIRLGYTNRPLNGKQHGDDYGWGGGEGTVTRPGFRTQGFFFTLYMEVVRFMFWSLSPRERILPALNGQETRWAPQKVCTRWKYGGGGNCPC